MGICSCGKETVWNDMCEYCLDQYEKECEQYRYLEAQTAEGIERMCKAYEKKVKTVYQTSDGKVYDSLAEATRQQTILDNNVEELYKKYLKHCGKILFYTYGLDHKATWIVYGADCNDKLSSKSSRPLLFVAKGTLEAVIRKAVRTPMFWSNDNGGEIRKIEIEEI